ncbi:DUF6880 family protein [Kineococcus sp. LSe6-4]|uniref:DUF6880 family protein n=1 Tax=Kineococcus halophytocola TaxID=3234027 RepID=A0ABV4H3C6_9ACTN
MSELSRTVLSGIRTRADLHRWASANAHGRQMHEAVDQLERALSSLAPDEAWDVTHRALDAAVKVIAHADDSSGIIGDACRRLLDLHPRAARAAQVPPATLVPWMVRFQFDGVVDFFDLDPVAYAPALGAAGLARYRRELDRFRAGTGGSHTEWVLAWNDRRLAVLDRDVEAIVRTHARDQRVAKWLQDTSEAMVEIGRIDLALDWARRAVDHEPRHQALRAADHLRKLVAEHRPQEALATAEFVFRRWPTASTAADLVRAAGTAGDTYREEILTTLGRDPQGTVDFCLTTLREPALAWRLAAGFDHLDEFTWSRLAAAHEAVDPLATLPVHRRLVTDSLVRADARAYRQAAVRLARMRDLAAGTPAAGDVEEFVAELRHEHRRRPRLQQEFDRVGLPR